jgi:hypothetical protein
MDIESCSGRSQADCQREIAEKMQIIMRAVSETMLDANESWNVHSIERHSGSLHTPAKIVVFVKMSNYRENRVRRLHPELKVTKMHPEDFTPIHAAYKATK